MLFLVELNKILCEDRSMPIIGYVTLLHDRSYRGRLATLTIRRDIAIVHRDDHQPGCYRIMAGDVEVGTGVMCSKSRKKPGTLRLSIASPEIGILAAELVPARSGATNEFAIEWILT